MWLTESDLLILEYNVDAIVKCCVGAFASAIALIFLILVIDTHVHMLLHLLVTLTEAAILILVSGQVMVTCVVCGLVLWCHICNV